MLAAIDWDFVWTAFTAWAVISLVPLVFFILLFAVYLACLGGAYFVHWFNGMRKYFAPKDRPMGHAKLDHIKYDIRPDGSLGPGDNRNLEGPE